MREQSITECEKIKVQEYPSYTTFLADQHGYRRAIKELIDLLPKEE